MQLAATIANAASPSPIAIGGTCDRVGESDKRDDRSREEQADRDGDPKRMAAREQAIHADREDRPRSGPRTALRRWSRVVPCRASPALLTILAPPARQRLALAALREVLVERLLIGAPPCRSPVPTPALDQHQHDGDCERVWNAVMQAPSPALRMCRRRASPMDSGGYHPSPFAANVTTSTAAMPTAIGAAIQKRSGGVRHGEEPAIRVVAEHAGRRCAAATPGTTSCTTASAYATADDLEQRHEHDQRGARVSGMAQRRKPNCGPGGKHDEHGDGVERDCVRGHMGAGGIVVSAGSHRIVVFKPRRPRGCGYADCARDALEKEDQAQTDCRNEQSGDGDRGHPDPDQWQRYARIPRSWRRRRTLPLPRAARSRPGSGNTR